MRFVLDNSVVCGWLLEDQATAYTDAVAARLENARAVAPALLRLEYTNVLRTACKRGRLTAYKAQTATQDAQLADAARTAGVGVLGVRE